MIKNWENCVNKLKHTKLISFARSLFLWYLGYITLVVRRGLASMLLLFAIAILIALTKNAFLIPVLYYQSWQGLSTLIWIWYTVLVWLLRGSGSLTFWVPTKRKLFKVEPFFVYLHHWVYTCNLVAFIPKSVTFLLKLKFQHQMGMKIVVHSL